MVVRENCGFVEWGMEESTMGSSAGVGDRGFSFSVVFTLLDAVGSLLTDSSFCWSFAAFLDCSFFINLRILLLHTDMSWMRFLHYFLSFDISHFIHSQYMDPSLIEALCRRDFGRYRVLSTECTRTACR